VALPSHHVHLREAVIDGKLYSKRLSPTKREMRQVMSLISVIAAQIII